MTLYGKIIGENGIQFAPRTYITESGSTIINFNLSEDLMRQEGFKPVSLVPPPEDDGETVYAPVYSDVGDRIEQNWEAVVVEPEEEDEGGAE